MRAFTRMEIATRQVIRVECVEAEDANQALAKFAAGEAVLLKETIGPVIQQEESALTEGWFSEPGLARQHYQRLHNLLGAEDRSLLQGLLTYIDEQIGSEGLEEASDAVQQAYGLLVDILEPEGIAEDGSTANDA